MNKQQTITINGVAYDAHTGLRVAQTDEPTQTPEHHRVRVNHAPASHAVHQPAHKSATLSRKHVAAPKQSSTSRTVIAVNAAPKTASRSPMIQKFATPQHTRPAAHHAADIAPVTHPVHHRATVKHAAHKQHHVQHVPASAHVQKEAAIAKALHNARPNHHEHATTPGPNKLHRFASVGSASLALVLLAGYFTYINLPNLSVRVAAAQAGIDASYPSYRPSGYSLSGPVAYNTGGQVSMKFAANTGPQNFNITQAKSDWDSSALLENYVMPASNGDYTTFSDQGLTVYVYGSNAAWVDGGILHTIQGDAQLSSDQIQHIATSM